MCKSNVALTQLHSIHLNATTKRITKQKIEEKKNAFNDQTGEQTVHDQCGFVFHASQIDCDCNRVCVFKIHICQLDNTFNSIF